MEWQLFIILLYLHWPEGGDQYGGEVKIGLGHEEIAEGRIDEHSIDKSIGRLQVK